MRLTFIGADHEVTGSCHVLDACGKNILIDCGMEQGSDDFVNREIPMDVTEIDYVLLTHAHIDHSGLLPWIFSRGFRGSVIATKATVDLCKIMLKDSAHIQEFEAEWKSRKAKRSGDKEFLPLYTTEDAEGLLELMQPCEYGTVINLGEGLSVRYRDAGHLLGSSSIEVWMKENDITKKLVFSGDIGNLNRPIIKDPQYIDQADYVVMESTYGDRYHNEQVDYVQLLTDICQKTFDRGGNVIIPAFAVGRTQEMLYYFRKIKQDGLIKGHANFEVYVDSPLAIEATRVFYDNEGFYFDKDAMDLIHEGVNPLKFKGLKLSITSDESKAINFDKNPKVIISASGMCEAGRIRHHLKHNLWREDSTIVFVGYQAGRTVGRMLLDGIDKVKIFGETITVKAEIVKLEGVSGHADKNGLIKWIQSFKDKPEKVFVVHGENEICDLFTKCLKQEYGYNAYAPYSGTTFDLITGELIEEKAIPIKKFNYDKKPMDSYERLVNAGKRLAVVIRHKKGRPNKELAKFTGQINSLCDKWDR